MCSQFSVHHIIFLWYWIWFSLIGVDGFSHFSSQKWSGQTSRGQGDQAQTHQKGAIRFACIKIYLEYNFNVDFSKHLKGSCLKEFQSNIQQHLWHAFVCFSFSFFLVESTTDCSRTTGSENITFPRVRGGHVRSGLWPPCWQAMDQTHPRRQGTTTKTKTSHLHLHNLHMQPHTHLCLYKDLELFIYHLTWVLESINSLKRHCFVLNFSQKK